MLRSWRSVTSIARRQVTVAISGSCRWKRWASTSAESRLFAAVIACMSPVKWRLMSSIGTTCA